MAFFIDPKEANKGVSIDRRQKLFHSIPQEVISLDDSVAASILRSLESRAGNSFRKHLLEIGESLRRSSGHVQITFVFRAAYIMRWCHELWRYVIQADVPFRFTKTEMALKPICMACTCPHGYRYARPKNIDFTPSVPVSPDTNEVIPEFVKKWDGVLAGDLMQMRVDGEFDQSMKLIAETMKTLQIIANDYQIFTTSIHQMTDGRLVVSPSFSIDTMSPIKPKPYSTFVRHKRMYFASCERCNGTGIDPENNGQPWWEKRK